MNNPKIVFLLESISGSRCVKRVKSFISNGYDVEIYGIDRGVSIENNFISGIKVNVFDKQKDGKDHFKKFIKNNKSIKQILNKYDKCNTVYYSFGFAITVSLLINGCKNYIYEMSDVVYGYQKYNLFLPFFKQIDKLMIKKSLLTILTSEGFADFFFDNKRPDNIIIQPNKLNIYFSDKQKPYFTGTFSSSRIKFAFVGGFRFPNTIFRFANIIGKYFPEHEFHFYGYGDSDLTNQVISISEKYDNVKYHGSFKNPEDLSSIYSNIDVIVSCYDIQDLNVRIAEPNKLYESLFFNKPIIVSKNTFLSKKVEKLNCGYTIDASNDESILSFLNTIKNEDMITIKESINKIPNNEIIDDNSINIISFLNKKIVQLDDD